ncbi:hypothetical protein BVRB_6g149000 [Beta vulgaris subsp. vulgaris]|uniref:GDSL esterase/lipase 7 n=1 Tax=Beta vulgaris subsp. vulgaris TaxID=3555 RepID=UPI00065C5B88|nr:GDSL esterase/lipase 7 [Beta vulgaris subsp. vulgaris]KMT07270.1 hypothetical protein BVRB_6g149000 [Beta vulgaris subsp. vulgaris]
MLPLFVALLLVFFPIFSRECSSEPLVPALYVFGDSLSDAGNNNHIPLTIARANYRPYGINFSEGITGRFSNGRTFADLIAEYLGLPNYPLAYRRDPRSETGYTYASGGCGILPETGLGSGCVPLDQQLIFFEETISKELRPSFGNPADLSQHLASSIFLVWVGSNDYLLNYFNTPVQSPQVFAQILIDGLSDKLKRLHELGARKFLVLEIGPLGCIPAYRKNGGHDETWCDDDKNSNAKMFNDRLGPMIQALTPTYSDSYFTRGNIYDLSDDAFKNPVKYGLTNVHSSCCTTVPGQIFNNIVCRVLLPWQFPCRNAHEYLFFDGAHPTEASYQILAPPCFNGSDVCVPYNIQQLAQLPTNSANLRSSA